MAITPLNIAKTSQYRLCDTKHSPREEITPMKSFRGVDNLYSIEKSQRSRLEETSPRKRLDQRSPKRLAPAVTAQPSPRNKSIHSGELSIMAAPANKGTIHAKAIGNWMMNTSARDSGFGAGESLNMVCVGKKAGGPSGTFSTRNRSVQLASRLSQATEESTVPNLQRIGRNVLGKGGHEDAMSMTVSSGSQMMPPLKKGKAGSSMQMTAREYVLTAMKKSEISGGVPGYNMPKPLTKFDQPLFTKIHSGTKKTFIDHEVKRKQQVPDARYDISIDWTRDKRSNFCLDKRHTLATDIERKAARETKPEPTTYSPKHKLVEQNLKGAFNFQANRTETGFLADPIFTGQKSPRFYDKRHSLVEKRVSGRKFHLPINAQLDAQPSFLRARKATALVSPCSHNPLEALKKAVLPKDRFYMRRGSPKTHVEHEIVRTKQNPGVGHYSIKNIEKAYDKITLGASKGWK